MYKTPGFVTPFSYSSEEELDADLKRRGEASGSTPFEVSYSEGKGIKHHGVKGMHWGVRKNTPTNANYAKSQQRYDRNNVGKGGVKRINRRMNKGMDIKSARKAEFTFRGRRASALVASAAIAKMAYMYGPTIKTILQMVGGVAAQSVAKRAETNRGRAAAANARGIPRMGSSGPSYAKKKRSGAYNISSI
jgi:hypothetical protein